MYMQFNHHLGQLPLIELKYLQRVTQSVLSPLNTLSHSLAACVIVTLGWY